MRLSLGFFIRRSIANPDAVRGKTFSSYGHVLYATREQAQWRLDDMDMTGMLDTLFTYDVAEAFMDVEDSDE